MVQLRSCYFCGTTGALSEYEALPRAVVVEETAPRVVLCDRCHTKLTNVLAPLVEGVERTDRRASGETDQPPAAGASTGNDRSLDESGTDAPERADSSTQEVTFSGSASTDTPDTETADPVTGTADPETRGPIEDTDDFDVAGESDDASVPGESDERAADTVDEREFGDGTETGDAADPDGDVAEDPDRAENRGQNGEAVNAASPSTDLDRVYYKLLRFLRNREFPIPRAEAEAVAQSAYDLTASEASQVIQRAIDRDVLEERGGELHHR